MMEPNTDRLMWGMFALIGAILIATFTVRLWPEINQKLYDETGVYLENRNPDPIEEAIPDDLNPEVDLQDKLFFTKTQEHKTSGKLVRGIITASKHRLVIFVDETNPTMQKRIVLAQGQNGFEVADTSAFLGDIKVYSVDKNRNLYEAKLKGNNISHSTVKNHNGSFMLDLKHIGKYEEHFGAVDKMYINKNDTNGNLEFIMPRNIDHVMLFTDQVESDDIDRPKYFPSTLVELDSGFGVIKRFADENIKMYKTTVPAYIITAKDDERKLYKVNFDDVLNGNVEIDLDKNLPMDTLEGTMLGSGQAMLVPISNKDGLIEEYKQSVFSINNKLSEIELNINNKKYMAPVSHNFKRDKYSFDDSGIGSSDLMEAKFNSSATVGDKKVSTDYSKWNMYQLPTIINLLETKEYDDGPREVFINYTMFRGRLAFVLEFENKVDKIEVSLNSANDYVDVTESKVYFPEKPFFKPDHYTLRVRVTKDGEKHTSNQFFFFEEERQREHTLMRKFKY